MTDSIKHFTGFDISGKMKPNCLKRQEAGIDVDKTMGKEN
jgi:lysyl-tRNA synthetase class 2